MSPDELDEIRERDAGDQHWNRAHLSEGEKDRHALLGLVDELLLREQRVTALLEEWHKEEHAYRREAEYGLATGLKDCQDDLRIALWPRQ